MAVKFQKDSFTIEIPSTAPVEDWLDLQSSLCDLLRILEQDSITNNFFHTIVLMESLMPDLDTAKKMTLKKGGE